jgi:ABC-2 type transport system permease protein
MNSAPTTLSPGHAIPYPIGTRSPFLVYLALARQLAFDFGRNSLTVFFVFVFPIAFLCLFEAGKLSQSVPRIRVALVSSPSDPDFARFSNDLSRHERLSVVTLDARQAQEELRAGGVDVALSRAPGSGVAGAGELVHVLTKERHATDPILLTLESVKARYLEAITAAPHQLGFTFSSILGASSLDFSTFAIPAIVVLALLQLAVFGTAAPLVAAREQNAFRNLFLAPIPVTLFLLAHVTVRLMIIVLQIAAIMLLMALVFGDQIYGSWIQFFLASAFGGAMLAALGYMLGALVANQQLGSLILNLINFGGMFLGQVLTDVSRNPYLYYVIHINPVTYVADACRQVALDVRGMHPLSVDLAVIGAFAAVFSCLAVFGFRRNLLHPVR